VSRRWEGRQVGSLGITAPSIVFSEEWKNPLLAPPAQFAARGCLWPEKVLFLLLLWQPALLAGMPSQKHIVTSAPSHSPAGAGRAGGCPVPSPACSQPQPQQCRRQVKRCWCRRRHPLPLSPPGAKKVTNKATLWYVPLSLKNVNKVLEVPPIQVGRLALLPQTGTRPLWGNGTNPAPLAPLAVPVALPTPFLPTFPSST